MFHVERKTRPRSELLEQAVEATETTDSQLATSHSMGDLLSYPKQAPYQELVQPGAIPSQCIVETSFYRNQIDRGFPRVDVDEYRSTRQDPFSIFRQRGAYPGVYSVDAYRGAVDEREHVYRPSTPTVSPVRLLRPRMPCPLISVTSDNEISSVIYQDESDESDDKITEEEEGTTEQGEAAISNLNYPMNVLNPFERITTPPLEYAGTTKDYKLLEQPLTFDRNLFDAIPYIDQTDDINFSEFSEYVQIKPSNKCEHCIKAGCDDNFNLRDSQKRTNIDRNRQQTLSVPESNFELDTRSNLNFSSITSSFPANESVLFVKDAAPESGSLVESKSSDSSHLQGMHNTMKRTLNIDERCEDKLDDISNSEDCADESSSTINDDCASSRADRDAEEGISTPKMYTVMPELHLDLSGLNSDVSSDESKTEKCWKSPEEVRLGCGKVAALAKHFSKLGDAGLIKFKSTKLNGSRQFVSEPNITTSDKSDEHLHRPCHAQKEYKSDSDLIREGDENSRICSAGRRNNVILVDVEADGDFAIEECKFHHCGAKRVTIARIPINEQIDTKESSISAIDENHDKNIIKDKNQSLLGFKKNVVSAIKVENISNDGNKDQVFLGTKKDATFADIDNNVVTNDGKSQAFFTVKSRKNVPGKVNITDSSLKLSLEQQQVIAEQLEQFSNLDDADAPLFIPEQDLMHASAVSTKNENNGASTVGDSTQPNLINQLEAASREKSSSLIDMDDNFQNMKKPSYSSSFSSLPSVRSPSPSHSSVVLSLSNVVKSSLSSEDIRSQIHQCCRKHPKCLFIDISHSAVKNCSNDSFSESSSMLPPSANAYSRLGDNKLNVLRMRIARPLCNSESNLIGSTIYGKEETERAIDFHDKSIKLTRSCESILNSKFLSDSDDRTRSSENLCEDLDLSRKFYNRLISSPKGSIRWHRHRSLEELKSKKGSRKRDNSMNSVQTAEAQTKFDKFFDDKLDSEDGEDIRWNCHLSLEELESKRESCEQDRSIWTNLDRTTEVQRSDCRLKKKLRTKHMSYDLLKDNKLKLWRENDAKDVEQQRLRVKRKSQSEFDVSRRKSDSERDDWSFREISSLNDDRSALRKLLLRVIH